MFQIILQGAPASGGMAAWVQIGLFAIIILFVLIGTYLLWKNRKGKTLQNGIMFLVFGLSMIVISLAVSTNRDSIIQIGTAEKYTILFSGLIIFIIGGILLAKGVTKK